MPATRALVVGHLSVLVLGLLAPSALAGSGSREGSGRNVVGSGSVEAVRQGQAEPAVPATPATDNSGSASFTVFLQGVRIGSQNVDLSRTDGGWLISSVGRLEAPFDLVTTRFEASYAADWQAQRLTIEGSVRGQPIALTTSFGPTTATTELTQNGESSSGTQEISAGAVVLPESFFGAYEALAARLATAAPGSQIPLYILPEAEATATVDRVRPRRILTSDGPVEIREFLLTIAGPGGATPIDVWVDSRNRMARVGLAAASVVVVRDDLASVMARVEHVNNPGDESLYIPANGFTLGATITKPPSSPARAPAVILVSGPGSQGRDYVTYGIPVFGQIAGRVAEAGYFVVRYDGRGTGQSGGRTETAGVPEYAEDVRAVISWLRKRKDVVSDRVTVVGYGDSGPIALLAARREKRIKGVALLAASGQTGHETTMARQDQMLSRLLVPESAKATRRELQLRINEAAVTGRGWDGIPASMRRRAETAWFKSWLQFDPAEVIEKLSQPLLVIHGALDAEVPLAEADRLEELSLARKKPATTHTRKTIANGVNHLLVEAPSGSTDEYLGLEARTVSPAVSEALLAWLPTVSAR